MESFGHFTQSVFFTSVCYSVCKMKHPCQWSSWWAPVLNGWIGTIQIVNLPTYVLVCSAASRKVYKLLTALSSTKGLFLRVLVRWNICLKTVNRGSGRFINSLAHSLMFQRLPHLFQQMFAVAELSAATTLH